MRRLSLRFRINLVITHVGLDDAELGALLDMNTDQPLPATPAAFVTSLKVPSPLFLYNVLPPTPVTYRSG